jgi:hypothetical protein
MRVGARIIEVCEILEELGPSGIGAVRPHLDASKREMTPHDASQFCRQATDMGLLTAEIPPGGKYKVYTVKPDWRERMKEKRPPVNMGRKVRPTPNSGMFSFAASIFQVGA